MSIEDSIEIDVDQAAGAQPRPSMDELMAASEAFKDLTGSLPTVEQATTFARIRRARAAIFADIPCTPHSVAPALSRETVARIAAGLNAAPMRALGLEHTVRALRDYVAGTTPQHPLASKSDVIAIADRAIDGVEYPPADRFALPAPRSGS